jgi:lactate dehydrogenase-like 2-hydroxyacid dehydrogenase
MIVTNADSSLMTSLMKRSVINVLWSEVFRKTLLIIGLRGTGIEVAKRPNFFGMHIIARYKTSIFKEKILLKTSGVHIEHDDVVVDDIRGLICLPESFPIADRISIHSIRRSASRTPKLAI